MKDKSQVGIPDGALLRVDYFRGNRDYLRAADVLAAAPFETAPDSFQFFFKKIARHPGEWKRSGGSPESSGKQVSAATLAITRDQQKERWGFLIDEFSTIVKRAENIDEHSILTDNQLIGEEFICLLTGPFSIWDFIVAAARAGGKQFFPDTQWYLTYIKGNRNCFPAQLEGQPLILRLGRRRGSFVEIKFAVGGLDAGELGLIQKQGR